MTEINSLAPVSSQSGGVTPVKPENTAGAFFADLADALKAQSETAREQRTHVVQSGDSLYRIAGRLKNTLGPTPSVTTLVKEMTALNHLKNPDLIFPGQVLQIPPTTSRQQTSRNPSVSMLNPPAAITTSGATAPLISLHGGNPISSLSPVSENMNFPLFPQQGNVILPAVIPISQFSPSETAEGPAAVEPQPRIQPAAITDETDETPNKPPVKTNETFHHDLQSQMAMYKEDQLLAHPGGDYFFLRSTDHVFDPNFDQNKFVNRVGKDIVDAGENLLNIAKNLALGAQYKYVSGTGDIKTGQEIGLWGTLKNFAEDVFSGLTFGAYVPGGEKAPEGVLPSVGHFFKKILYEAPIRDILIGVPHAAANIVKDTALASLNLLEAIPDATIGNFEWGQKATTTVFDNGQVVVDYLTDVLPGGNAWLRVHAAGARGDMEPPVYFNLMTSEQGIADSRWATVRNTSFRKTIETIGSLLSDAAIAAFTTHAFSPSSDQRHN